MNRRGIWAIARKDMLIVRRSRPMFYPLIIISFLVLVMLPALITLAAQDAGLASSMVGQVESAIQHMPGSMQEALESRSSDQERMIILGNVYFLAPFYLLVPLLVATVIAADTFAGEKERGTLEALLYTPMTDRELLSGKLLAAWLPAVVVGVSGFLIYSVILTLTAWPVMGGLFFPNGMWLLLVFWLGPAVAGLGLGAMVLVSARVSSLQEATQLGGGVVLPFVLLIAGQATGVLFFSSYLVAALGLILWILNAALFTLAMRRFKRESLLIGGR
jgi:ABC-2 type transport system permease protein